MSGLIGVSATASSGDAESSETVCRARAAGCPLRCEDFFVDMWHQSFLVAEWRLKTFWDNITHYKTKSVHLLGLMNPATKVFLPLGVGLQGFGSSGSEVTTLRAHVPK